MCSDNVAIQEVWATNVCLNMRVLQNSAVLYLVGFSSEPSEPVYLCACFVHICVRLCPQTDSVCTRTDGERVLSPVNPSIIPAITSVSSDHRLGGQPNDARHSSVMGHTNVWFGCIIQCSQHCLKEEERRSLGWEEEEEETKDTICFLLICFFSWSEKQQMQNLSSSSGSFWFPS